jgi:alkylation response protein AidB-like acyl-CoA dehydrogenase
LTRWTAFEELGRLDATLVRLAEGHADALAILAEFSAPIESFPTEQLWGVWAAAPESVRAEPAGDGWQLSGTRPWCSGAGVCTRALVTARAPDGTGLFALSTNQQQAVRPVDDSWPAIGMSGTDSRTVQFDQAVAVRIGGPDAYVDRAGFWYGGAGVAACWYGAALGVAEDFRAAVRDDPHQLAHLGAVDAALTAGRAVLDAHAQAIDADPHDLARTARRRTMQTRAVIEDVAERVLQHANRALGAGPLSHDRRHARRVADLSLYLRQSHAERDLAALGTLVSGEPAWPWPRAT